MEIIRSPREMRSWSKRAREAARTLALVPTMGFFHDGHLGLMRRGKEVADQVVVSLFVNPIQFGPNEDLARYPRAFERDRDLAEKAGVAVLFVPAVEDVYPAGFATRVEVDSLTATLCGASRPGHFAGVTTVVTKLFNMVQPDCAIFGEKDFQQLAVIRKMVADLNMPVSIVSHPIVREADGLAMSSRNAYLSPEERIRALSLSRSLRLAREQVAAGEQDPIRLRETVVAELRRAGADDIDYVEIVDADTLAPSAVISEKSLLALAVRIGRTRLIDNTLLVG